MTPRVLESADYLALSPSGRLLYLVVLAAGAPASKDELVRWTGWAIGELKPVAQEVLGRGLITKEGDGVRLTAMTLPVPVESGSLVVDRAVRGAEVLPEGFVKLWRIYPRDDGRKEALKAYTRVNPTAAQVDQWLDAIRQQVQMWTIQGRTVDKVPHLSTWIRGERWNDSQQVGPVGRGEVSARTAANLVAAQGALQLIRERYGVAG